MWSMRWRTEEFRSGEDILSRPPDMMQKRTRDTLWFFFAVQEETGCIMMKGKRTEAFDSTENWRFMGKMQPMFERLTS